LIITKHKGKEGRKKGKIIVYSLFLGKEIAIQGRGRGKDKKREGRISELLDVGDRETSTMKKQK